MIYVLPLHLAILSPGMAIHYPKPRVLGMDPGSPMVHPEDLMAIQGLGAKCYHKGPGDNKEVKTAGHISTASKSA